MIEKFKTYDELMVRVQELAKEGKSFMCEHKTDDLEKPFGLEIQPAKMYKAQDGKEYRDEAWLTADGRLIQIQDLTEEHAKNILRRVIRDQREAQRMVEAAMLGMAEEINSMGVNDDTPDWLQPDAGSPGKFLH